MKQTDIIETMKNDVFPHCQGLKAAMLIGSCANGNMTSKSDIDIILWIEASSFSEDRLDYLIRQNIPDVAKTLKVELRNKYVVYFQRCPKMELIVINKKEEVERLFLGSEINDVDNSILYADAQVYSDLQEYLHRIVDDKLEESVFDQTKRIVRELANKFVYEFENASDMHKRSDPYMFYYFYNIALHVAVQLRFISQKGLGHYYLPKHFAQSFCGDELNCFRKLNGSLYLPDAYEKKHNLLEFFYDSLDKLNVHTKKEIMDIRKFLDDVYERDYLWNFRDASDLNPAIMTRKIFRSSCFARYQNSPFFDRIIKKLGITVIVDLRDNKEFSEHPYNFAVLKKLGVRYVQIHVDVRPPDEFGELWKDESPRMIGYRWFALGNKTVYHQFYNQIDPVKDVILIHCHAGQDRTGVFIALVALLADESENNIETDYLESGKDADVACIRAFIDSVKSRGGAVSFLQSCGIDDGRIFLWKQTLKRRS